MEPRVNLKQTTSNTEDSKFYAQTQQSQLKRKLELINFNSNGIEINRNCNSIKILNKYRNFSQTFQIRSREPIVDRVFTITLNTAIV